MSGLTRLAWRTLVARPARTTLTAIGIALGVGVLFASLATSAGIDTSIDRTVADIVGRADLRIAAFQDRGLSDATVRAIRTTSGVEVAAPETERRTYLRRSLGGSGPLPPPVTVLGIDPIVDPRVHDPRIVEGFALSRPDEGSAVITERLARDDGYGLGSELTIQGAGDPETFRVIGIAAGEGPQPGSAGRTVTIPIAAARRIFALDGVSRVDVVVAEDASAVTVAAALGPRLTAQPYVLSSPGDLAASLRASTTDFQATTALMAAVALFGGAFLIFNTLSMTVNERIREVGLLRAAGATRRQVVGFVLAGAALLGVVGSILGLVVGFGLATLMAGYVRTIAAVPLDRVEASPVGAALAIVIGILVTVAAATEPAWRASRISPVEALRPRLDPTAGRAARLRWLVVVFVTVGVVGFVAWPHGALDASVVRWLAVYAVLLVATLLSPVFLRPLGRLAGLPFARIARLEERLARGSLGTDRGRTALTHGALTIGLAMIVAIGGVAAEARRAATAWLVGVIPGDEVVTSIRPVAADEGVADALGAIDGVARVTPIATFDIAYRGYRLDAAAVVGADLLADGRLEGVDGDRSSALAALDAGGSAVIARSTAARLGLSPGSTMAFAIGDGKTLDLRVAAVVERTIPGRAGEAVLVGWHDATASFGVTGADFFAVRFAPGRAAAARPSLEATARTLALEPNPLERVQGAVSSALGQVFGLFDALALVAVLVAALGIVNTLTMNVVERVREFGVLRATGMTRRQVSRMVVVEAGILGIVGAALGIVTGLAAGAVMVALGGGRLELSLDLPWVAILVAAILGIAVSMVAAYYPARLASGLSIVRAVQFE